MSTTSIRKARSVLCYFHDYVRYTFLPKRNFASSTMNDYKWSIHVVSPEEHHEPIKMPHKELIFLGRSPDTRIVDPRCSRKQVQLMADLKTGEVQVTRLGANSSAMDGIEIIQNKVYSMKPTSTLYVLTGLYPQKLSMKKTQHHEHSQLKESTASKNTHQNHKSNHDSIKTTSLKESDSKSHKRSKHSSETSSSNKNASSSSKEKVSSSSNKHSKSTDSSSSHAKKRPASVEVDESQRKKQRLSLNEPSKKGSPVPRKDSDADNLKNVAAKLEMLKSNAKLLKTPGKKEQNNTSPLVDKKMKTGVSNSSSTAATASWSQYESLYVYISKGLKNSNLIAGFDIDGTIITTQSGKVFPTHPGDWRMLNKDIPKKLKRLVEKGYKIVFFTNQMGVSRGKTKIEDLKEKFEDVISEIDLPVQILISTKGGKYRKPCIGMWEYLLEKGNGGMRVDVSDSFYVGDAAGRPKDWMPKKKKDFSCSDRLFAMNLGLDFKTPEEYFLGYPPAKFVLPDFDPRKINSKTPVLDPEGAKITSDRTEVILLVGFPAAGKSHFVKNYLQPKGYTHINRDTLGTWQKCVSACADSLKKGTSVVVDNTNPDPASRERYVSVAKKFNVPCRCFVFNTSLTQAKHNERFREMTDKTHQAISDMVMNSFKSKFKFPEIKEGFSEIVKVNIVPKFQDPKLEKLYRMFLLEK